MSKIPQGEWTAIAARHAKGESISRIAETYGCTPPAIHYILKQSRQHAAQKSERRLNGQPHLVISHVAEPRLSPIPVAQKTPRPEPPRSAEPRIEVNGTRGPIPAENRSPLERPVDPQPAGARSQPTAPERTGNRDSALTAGLDRDLLGKAESAIAAFRSCFDAALTESSRAARDRLRQAASDVMRIAARTTIVLDRLSANVDGEATRVPAHTRPGYPR